MVSSLVMDASVKTVSRCMGCGDDGSSEDWPMALA